MDSINWSDTANWRWLLHKFNKEYDIETNFLVMTNFIALTVFAILIFIIISTFIQKFRYKEHASNDSVFEPVETEEV